MITLLNYIIIFAISSSVISVTMDFMAMIIILEFSNIFYSEHSDKHPLKLIVKNQQSIFKDLLTVCMTTSKECEAGEINKFKPLKATVWIHYFRKAHNQPLWSLPSTIRVTNRSCPNRMMFVTYKLLRLLFISFWFYFSPLILANLQFALPLYVLQRDGVLPTQVEDPEADRA